MTKKKDSFDELISMALDNAINDRDRAIEAYDSTKGIYDINLNDPSTLQGLMLLGQNTSKLLEICQKSNEQIIKLAQIKKDNKIKDKNVSPISISDLREAIKNSDELDDENETKYPQ